MGNVRRLSLIATLALFALTTGACAKLHPRTIGPPLDAPTPPPRVVPVAVQPIASQPLVASPPVGEAPVSSPSERIPPERPAATAAAAAAAPAPRPEPAPAARPVPDAPEPRTLQTTANPAAAEQRTRASLASATRDLDRIDARTLGVDARAQYDIARRFVTQASDALNKKNFEFAEQLADKAATLAALLQKR